MKWSEARVATVKALFMLAAIGAVIVAALAQTKWGP
jgi:hypothetical protein